MYKTTLHMITSYTYCSFFNKILKIAYLFTIGIVFSLFFWFLNRCSKYYNFRKFYALILSRFRFSFNGFSFQIRIIRDASSFQFRLSFVLFSFIYRLIIVYSSFTFRSNLVSQSLGPRSPPLGIIYLCTRL